MLICTQNHISLTIYSDFRECNIKLNTYLIKFNEVTLNDNVLITCYLIHILI